MENIFIEEQSKIFMTVNNYTDNAQLPVVVQEFCGQSSTPQTSAFAIVGYRTMEEPGIETYRVITAFVDNHYLLQRKVPAIGVGFVWQPFGIEDITNPTRAYERMRTEAKRLGEMQRTHEKNKHPLEERLITLGIIDVKGHIS